VSWVYLGSPLFSTNTINFPDLAVDSGGTPYLAFKDYYTNKANVMKYTGGGGSGWAIVGSADFSPVSISSASLYLDGTTPYVAFNDVYSSSQASVMKFNGTYWAYVGKADFTAGGAGYLTVAVNGGIPYVAFGDGANGWKAAVMSYH
jgi:hypothetical protein